MIFSKDRRDKDQIVMDNSDGFLKGKLLVATPSIQDSCFTKSVVLICDHTKNGGMGLIINKHLRNVDQADLYSKLGLEKPVDIPSELKVYFGGPVDTTRGFVVHSDDYSCKNTISIAPGVSVTSEHHILHDYVNEKGPSNLALVMGYSGWVGGQLEKEIEENSWIAFPADPELVFGTHDDSKWQQAGIKYGVDLNLINPTIGNA